MALATTDPNWLLSSVAQSAAALVAIIGGFLVSRLVSLAVDRNRLLERQRDLTNRVSIQERRLDEAHSRRFARTVQDFVGDHLKEAVDSRGVEEVDALLTWIPPGSSEEEMRPVAEDLLREVSEVFTTLQRHVENGGELSSEVEDLRSFGVEVPSDYVSERVYGSVATKMIEDRKKLARSRSSFPSLDIPSIGITSPAVVGRRTTFEALAIQRQDRRIEEERSAAYEVESLEQQIADVDEALRGLKTPDLTSTVWVLAYLAAVGIVLPVVFMALRPVPSERWARWLVVGAFASGLVLLLWHMMARIRGLGFTAVSEDLPELAVTGSAPELALQAQWRDIRQMVRW